MGWDTLSVACCSYLVPDVDVSNMLSMLMTSPHRKAKEATRTLTAAQTQTATLLAIFQTHTIVFGQVKPPALSNHIYCRQPQKKESALMVVRVLPDPFPEPITSHQRNEI